MPIELLARDINMQFQDFLEQITIKYVIPTYSDPYTEAPITQTYGSLSLMISWHEVITRNISEKNEATANEGYLYGEGNSEAIYQGNINLANYHLTNSTLIRKGITYYIEAVVLQSENRWILKMKGQK